MTTLIAWGNIRQDFPDEQISDALPTNVSEQPSKNASVQQLRQCRLLAHFLLRELCKTAKISTALLAQINRMQNGRPRFPVEHIDFNISHSGDWVAVILNVTESGSGIQSAVGIDIEVHKTRRNLTALLAHFAEQSEQDWYASRQDRVSAFYRSWCLREAVLKSQGVGIAKLNEVRHNPSLNLLHSAHCPQGRLVFSAELPFYLAVFAAGNALQDARYLKWNNGMLEECPLKSAVDYLVNF